MNAMNLSPSRPQAVNPARTPSTQKPHHRLGKIAVRASGFPLPRRNDGVVAFLFTVLLTAAAAALPALAQSDRDQTMCRLTTTLGDIDIALDFERAPVSSRNFAEYVKAGHFDNLIFHRVIPGFMIQGGGFTADMAQRETGAPIENEADNGLKNVAGSIAMARTAVPNSATSQFFINLVDNAFLDHTAKTQQGWGYAVFGKVVAGMDVVNQIAAQPTATHGPHRDVPVEAVVILKAKMK